ncbi:hypothetical protein BDB00DRAFT_120823 [Zychaea mexicana]|uniref:uncharacterized protein n=1 Tax=Zychaea mexicana TaxID=64656 RepID=UPI0022FF0122|nr:uncharacterized protein BDB00DRAFT_120823 [Zychaea mexicana]KAI9496471.1 hypothetical protein BDB00DRAFT_120823 [Zychaea mexicana]
MPKTPPLLLPTTCFEEENAQQQQQQPHDDSDDQLVLDDDRAWQMLEDQEDTILAAAVVGGVVSSSSPSPDSFRPMPPSPPQPSSSASIKTTATSNTVVGLFQQQHTIKAVVQDQSNNTDCMNGEGSDANNVDDHIHQDRSSSSPEDDDPSSMDVPAINTKVNELVQALVDAMQQSTEDLCQAEGVTRSMIDGLKGYRESTAARGSQLEQTWQDMRIYAASIAGHRATPQQRVSFAQQLIMDDGSDYDNDDGIRDSSNNDMVFQ